MSNLFDDFQSFEFPTKTSAVYALGIESKNQFVPFYIGETTDLDRRISEYLNPNFDAPTDFRVGEAIKYLKARGYVVIFKFKLSDNPEEEEKAYTERTEKEITDKLLRGSYDYKTSDPEAERKRAWSEVDEFLRGIP